MAAKASVRPEDLLADVLGGSKPVCAVEEAEKAQLPAEDKKTARKSARKAAAPTSDVKVQEELRPLNVHIPQSLITAMDIHKSRYGRERDEKTYRNIVMHALEEYCAESIKLARKL